MARPIKVGSFSPPESCVSRSPGSFCSSLGPTPRALSGLLAPGAGVSQRTGASAATAATGLHRLFLCFCFSRRSAAKPASDSRDAVSYTHLRAHETVLDLVCRLLLEKKKT